MYTSFQEFPWIKKLNALATWPKAQRYQIVIIFPRFFFLIAYIISLDEIRGWHVFIELVECNALKIRSFFVCLPNRQTFTHIFLQFLVDFGEPLISSGQ